MKQRLTFAVPTALYKKLRRYAKNNAVPMSRIIRNCLLSVDWENNPELRRRVMKPKGDDLATLMRGPNL